MTATRANRGLSGAGRGGLAVVLGAVGLMAIAAGLPYIWQVAIAAQLSDSRDVLALIEQKTRNTANRKGAALTSADNIASVFIAGNTPGLALAELQRLAGALAEQNGLVLERTQPLPAEEKDGLATLRMEVETSGSIAGLRGYLHAIETGTPLIFVRRANVSAGQSEGESAPSLPSERLSARLELEAFAWWEAAQ